MPYKDLERKKEWERLHRPQRLARRRELRHIAAAEQTTRPGVTRESSGGVAFLVPLVAGGALAAYNPKLGMGAGGLTLVVAAVWKKNWAARGVRHFTYRIAFLFHECRKNRQADRVGRTSLNHAYFSGSSTGF